MEWVTPAPRSPRPARRGRLGRALASTVAVMLALFLVSVSASVYYALTMSEEYTGRALVQFRPRSTPNGGVVSNETAASAAASYGAYLGTPSTIRTVASQISVGAIDLREHMDVQLVPATTSLSITFESRNPAVAARAASALAQVAAERASDDPLVSATVLAPASVPDSPSTPSRTIVVAAGALLGVVLAAVAYVVLQARRGTGRQAAAAQPEPRPAGTGTVPTDDRPGPTPVRAPAEAPPADERSPERKDEHDLPPMDGDRTVARPGEPALTGR